MGHIVSQSGISVDPAKVDKVRHWPTPQNPKEVQQFLGLANYYRRFIQGFAQLAKPLHRRTERNFPFTWTDECQTAFDNLRQKLTSTPILAYPNFEKPFILDTDASNTGIGAVLSQAGDDGCEHVIAYASRLLTKPERQYCVTRRELLAVITFTRHFRPYLLNRRFTLRTDHGSLQWLRNFKEPEGQVARWLEALQELDFEIIHRRGRLHSNADALSRTPCVQCGRPSAHEFTEERAELVGATTITARKDDEIKQQQLQDPILREIIECKQKNTRPQPQQNLESRRLLQLWDQLLLKQDLLYCTLPSAIGPGLQDKLVIPKVLRPEILKDLHEGSLGGHLGTDKTLGKLKERFYWPGHYKDVQQWCSSCAQCAMRKSPAPRPKAKLCNITVGSPMELVAMDILGPLPETAAGNSYVLVVGDYFTKWMEVYPIPNQDAITVANKLVNEFICRFSVPRQLHSDQGAQFESQVIAEVCKLLHIEKSRTTAYHPQSDGLIERFNRTLIQMLATCADTHPFNWEDHIKKVCMAYNVSKQSSTQYSPFFLMFGRQAQLPIDIMYGTPHHQDTTSEYARNLQQTFTQAFTHTRQHTGMHQERQAENYNKKIHGNAYENGKLVWLFNPVIPKGRSKKFHKPWTGPYRVLTKLSDSTYRIKHTNRPFKIKVVHFDRLKPCHSDIRLPREVLPHTVPRPPQAHTSQPPIGTNVEIVDVTELRSPVENVDVPEPERRYPLRASRQAPARYDDFMSH